MKMNLADSTITGQLFASWIETSRRNAIALIDEDVVLTFSELDHRVRVIAARLRQLGVDRGDCVAIGMRRSAEQVVTLLAVLAAGGCACPLEPMLAQEETARRMVAVGITALIYEREVLHGIDDLPVPNSRRWEAKVFEFEEDPSHRAGQRTRLPDWRGDDGALMLFTSGSTGLPKGVLLTQRNLLANAQGVISHTRMTGQDRLLHVMPMYHANGVNNQLLTPLLAGGTVILCPRFKAETMPQWMAEYRPTIITGVPTMYSRMLDQSFAKEALSELRIARCGSAPISDELQRQIERHLHCELVTSYGLSESTCTTTMNPPGARRIGSIGTVIDGLDVSLRLADGQRTAEPGMEGEICISGATVMAGYVGASGARNLDAPENGLLRTGDIGRFDKDGYLYITGRIKDVIIRGGENLSPARIEGILTEMEGVRAACVVGRKHHDLGEVPVACVTRRSGVAVDCAELNTHIMKRLGRMYLLDEIRIVESLPENSIGKIDRKVVAHWFTE
jgi:acyl-CoA synthetase (AMP-forming)/AMP-acid ligase II